MNDPLSEEIDDNKEIPPPEKTQEKEKQNKSSKVDVMGEAAMLNGYYISHNVQDFLWFRGIRYRTRDEEEKREAVFREFLETLQPR